MGKTLYYGGDIITMEDDTLYASAVLVEDGKIAAVCGQTELEQLKQQPNVEKVDLQGNTMLPAFIDPHSHITSVAIEHLCSLDLSDADSFAEIARRAKAYVAENHIKPGEWVIGCGYDHNLLKEKRHPDRKALDLACPDNPFMISHASGHMGSLNSLALQEMKITAQTPDPEGGLIARDENGAPDGYMEEKAFMYLGAKLPQKSMAEKCDLMVRAQEVYLKNGITTAQDGMTGEGEWELLKKLSEDGKLKIDVVCYIDQNSCPQVLKDNPDWYGTYRGGLKIGGYKIFLDGSPQGRTAWMLSPYLGGEKDYKGYPIYQDEQVEKFVRQAVTENVQQLAHCNGDAASEQMVRCYEKVLDGGKASNRPVMVHAQLAQAQQIERMAKIDMIASFFVAHTYFWGDVHIQNFGEERAQKISMVHTAIENGLRYTFHQDAPVIQPDMLMTIWAAVNRLSRNGVVMGADQRISVLEALRGVTVNAAYQYYEEDVKGSIKAGKVADFVILDRNPLKVDPIKIRDIQVLKTIKAGKLLYEKA